MAARNTKQAAPQKMSHNYRTLKQAVKLLGELQPNILCDGILNHKFEELYYNKIRQCDGYIAFKFVFFRLKKLGAIISNDKNNPRLLKFNSVKVQQILTNALAQDMSALSLNEPYDTPPGKRRNFIPEPRKFFKGTIIPLSVRVNSGIVGASNSSKTTPSRLFKDQRFGFRLSDMKPNFNSLEFETTACKVCGKDFKEQDKLLKHKETDEHLFRAIYQSCNAGKFRDRVKVPSPLSGIDIGVEVESAGGSEGRDVLKVGLALSSSELTMKFQAVKNVQLLVKYNPPKNNFNTYYLERTFLIYGGSGVIMLESNPPREMLCRDSPIRRNLNFKEGTIGIKEYIVVFKFLKETKPFQINEPTFVMKKIYVRVDNDATVEDSEAFPVPVDSIELNGVAPDLEQYLVHSYKYITTKPSVLEVADPPPKPKRELKFTRNLKEYPMKVNHNRFFNSGFKDTTNILPNLVNEKREVLELLLKGITEDNYDKFLSLLLHLEEHQMQYDLRSYSMKNAKLGKKYNLISVQVPGLAENRPSVIKGDALFMTTEMGPYQGYVHRVAHNELYVGMGKEFMSKFVINMHVTVDFSFNRTVLKLQHRALEMLMASKQVPNILFPKTCGAYTQVQPVKTWINQQVANNPQQCQAVQNIINGTSLPAPYLVFGPPGTGKTVTLVEAIKQLYFLSEKNYVLATAPSNAAVDLLAERVLQTLPPSQVLRLYSPTREWSSVPIALQRVCNFYSGDVHFPAKEKLMKYRVIVTTVICAGRLVSGGFPMGHFTHIFIDECGHGLEPQVLVAVAGLLGCEPKPGQLVLSGDPKQLGPVIRSPVAKQLGLEQTLLERLMTSCDLYQKKDGYYNPQVLTKLVKNFRSHPAILEVPNELFYDGDLEFCGDKGVTYSACNWDVLPKQGIPIIFHGIEGKDAQDEFSPSFYNVAEIDIVVKYVQKIMSSKFCGQVLRPADIGIISPYRRQITKLKRALEKTCKNVNKIKELTVGSVEEFQGQERRVIIVSTVRSDPAQLSLDRKFRLGFLREAKRFNVLLTRAKALLIIVGNPHILCTDANWRKMLEWCLKNEVYIGSHFSDKYLKISADLLPVDLDLQRVPVQEKLQTQLNITQELLKHQDGTKNAWKAGTDVNQILKDLKQGSDTNDENEAKQVSKLEAMVSPPFTILEQ